MTTSEMVEQYRKEQGDTRRYGLPVTVLRNIRADGTQYDCTMNGISANHQTLILADVKGGHIPLDEAKYPIVYLRTKQIGAKTYYNVAPTPEGDNSSWYSMGGNFIWTSDSRFPFDYPLPIHDRKEW